MASRVRLGLIAGLALVGGLTVACGGSTPAAPVVPATPVVLATPTPPAPPPPVGFVCPLPPSSNVANNCPKLPAKLGEYMNTAIDRVLVERPELFDFKDMAGGNPKVLDRQK